MLKRHIKYVTFLGETVEEDHWFNLTERELSNLDLKNEGGFQGLIRRMIETTDTPQLIELFEQVVLASYGELSADGKVFRKKDGELAKEFVDSAAYDALYMELIGDANELAEFINGIIPEKLRNQANSPEAQAKIEALKKEYHLDRAAATPKPTDHMPKTKK